MAPLTPDRCGSCVHWQNPWDTYTSDEGKVPEVDRPRWGTCQKIGLPDFGAPAEGIAFTKDGSDYRADLHCRDDFGCVLHEPQQASR